MADPAPPPAGVHLPARLLGPLQHAVHGAWLLGCNHAVSDVPPVAPLGEYHFLQAGPPKEEYLDGEFGHLRVRFFVD